MTGAEFYYERLQKAQALDPASRRPDIQAWLDANVVLEEAAEVLLSPDVGSMPDDVRVIALLKYLDASHAVGKGRVWQLRHPKITIAGSCLRALEPLLLPPQGRPSPALLAMLHHDAQLPRDASILVKLLVFAWFHVDAFDMTGPTAGVLRLIRAVLEDADAAEDVERSLEALRCRADAAGGASKSGWQVPDLAFLQQVCWFFTMELLAHAEEQGAEAQIMSAAQAKGIADAMAAATPRHPRSLACLIHINFKDFEKGIASGRLEGAQAWARIQLQQLELAREMASDFWIALTGYTIISTAPLSRLPELPPADAARLADEADAAYKLIKSQGPYDWAQAIKIKTNCGKLGRLFIDTHLSADSPGRWRADLVEAARAFMRSQWDTSWSEAAEQARTCGGCKKVCLAGAKVCSACRGVTYCSRDCQRNHWKEHKKACKATRKQPMGEDTAINSGNGSTAGSS